MTGTPHRILAVAVACYDEENGPVTPAAVGARLDLPPSAVAERLETLVNCELLAHTEYGYRPTVTGREFLDLGVEGGVVIVDPDGDE